LSLYVNFSRTSWACSWAELSWLQFLFFVKAAALKQQISKFYPQILSTEASRHIFFSQRVVINVKASFGIKSIGGLCSREKFWLESVP